MSDTKTDTEAVLIKIDWMYRCVCYLFYMRSLSVRLLPEQSRAVGLLPHCRTLFGLLDGVAAAPAELTGVRNLSLLVSVGIVYLH